MDTWLVLEFVKTAFVVGWMTWLLKMVHEEFKTGAGE